MKPRKLSIIIGKLIFSIFITAILFVISSCYLLLNWGEESSSPAGPVNITNVVYDTNNITITTNTFTIGPTNFMVINSTNVLGTNISMIKYDTTNISTRCWISNWAIYSNIITNLYRNITNAFIYTNFLVYSKTNDFYFTNLIVLTKCGNAYTIVWVITFAGSGTAGSTDGISNLASFNYPKGVALDSYGNVFVADYNCSLIRKITPAGMVTKFAGSGTAAWVDGTGTAASFNYPAGVAVDSSGNVYVADYYNNRIRKITPAGVVTTFAGTGSATPFIDNVPATTATFNYPAGVAVDTSGNVYVADQNNNRIRKITPAGVVSTFAGTGSATPFIDNVPATTATFNYPAGVAVDTSGNVYVADQNNNRIRKITPAGAVTTLAGSGTAAWADGTGTAASFNNPSGIAVDSSGNIYVADEYSYRIRKITPAGVVTTLAGSGTHASADGAGKTATFSNPYGITVDSYGNLYVADMFNNKIRKILQ